MSIQLQVFFLNGTTVVYGGQILNGLLKIAVPEASSGGDSRPIRTKEINLQIKGKAKWTIHVGRQKTIRKCTFYLQTLRAFGDGLTSSTLERGKIALIPFSIILPENSPSSISSTYGGISYHVKVQMQRSWWWDRKVKFPFTVQGVLDIATPSFAADPILVSKGKNVCCFCCASGQLTFTFCMARDGLFSGSTVPFSLIVDNDSGNNVSKIRVDLFQRIRYQGFHGEFHRMSNKVLASAVGDGVTAQSSSEWKNGFLDIPDGLPPSNSASVIISIEYFIKVKLTVKGFTCNLTHFIPVLLGFLPQTPMLEVTPV